MKKVSFFIIMVAICILSITINAKDVAQSNASANESISNILKNQLSTDDLNDLKNDDLYGLAKNPISIDNEPIIKIYNVVYWEFSNMNLDEILLIAEQAKTFDYVALNQDVRLRKIISTDNISIGISSEQSSLNYVDDIRKITSDFEILNKQCKILNIYCFDGFTSLQGASVYFVTDQGIYIRYYENKHSEGVWFEEKQYKKYASDYYEYISSPENNYNEFGEPINGGNMSFVSYINSLSDSVKNTESVDVKDDTNELFIILLIIIVLILVFVIICLYLKRKRGKTNVNRQ